MTPRLLGGLLSVLLISCGDEKYFDEEHKEEVQASPDLALELDPPCMSQQAVKVVGSSRRWPNATIYYDFASGVSSFQRTATVAAMGGWQVAVPGLTFVQHTTQPDWVLFDISTAYTGCQSPIGHFSGMTTARWQPSCVGSGTALHELGHVLGLYHEQTRKDQQSFIAVQWSKIKGCPDNALSYEDCGSCAPFTCGCGNTTCNNAADFANSGARSDILDYDFASVMHYPQFNPATKLATDPSFVAVDPNLSLANVGYASLLSAGDMAKMRVMYPRPYIPTSVFRSTVGVDFCTLSGREADVATVPVTTGWPVTVTSGRTIPNVAEGVYTVTCTLKSAFWNESYDYPNTSVSINFGTYPAGDVETYVTSGVVTVLNPGLIVSIIL